MSPFKEVWLDLAEWTKLAWEAREEAEAKLR